MRVPLSWLHEYVDFDLSVEELVDLFSLRSQEIDGVYRLGVAEGEVVVGEVQEFGPHPNADRLSVAKVDLGGQTVQVVAGAPNPHPGARVPIVRPGSVMADGTKLKKAKLRGLESDGMMMSERELGISGDHGRILLLDDTYEVGRPIEDYFPIGETIIDIDVTPNRPDLWGMIGVARELAAILETDFRIPEPRFETSGEPTSAYGLRVEAGDLCPRYDLRRISKMPPGGKAPLSIRRHIFAAGMRPINAIVDATNYVMLETGQPTHAFDARKVRDGIVVRRARAEEKITLLDDSTRTLDEDMLVIADEERGLVIAGVMGAEDAEVSDETEDVLIEVATFDGRNILETSSRLGLRTDASGRFERGLDPNMVDYAMDRVTDLLSANPGGEVAEDTLSHYPEPVSSWEVPLRLKRAELLLGMPVQAAEAADKLERLGCEVQSDDEELRVAAPTFRQDLRREADLIEEVGRLIGLDRIPEEIPGVSLPGGLAPEQYKVRQLRRTLADLGFAEAITYPFGPDRWTEAASSQEDTESANSLRLKNPLSAEARNLRSTLLPGLLDAVARNRSFGERGGALFEVGHVFEAHEVPSDIRDEALHFRMTGETGGQSEEDLMGVREVQRVSGVLAGVTRPAGWNAPAARAGFFEAKGIVERIAPGAVFEARTMPNMHPGRSAAVLVNGEEAGWVGEIHPEAAESFDLEGWTIAAFELDVALCNPDSVAPFKPFVNVPAVVRDLAVIVDKGVSAGAMLAAVDSLGSDILTGSRIFDVYEGSQLPDGKKSVALSFTFQGTETLTDERIEVEVERISERLKSAFGARVRDS